MKNLLIIIFFPFLSLAQTKIGSNIFAETIGDRCGYSVSISSDGNILAIGAFTNGGNGFWSGQTRVYENQSNVWSQLGNDIDGENYGDSSGVSVSLSSEGNIVAIGAPQNHGNGIDSGHVRIYENQSNVWSQLGNDIDGEYELDGSGVSVSLSSDGNIVAIGAPNNDGNGTDSGHVRVYKNESGIWMQIGEDIDGEVAGDKSGFSVSLSSNGNIVAIGAYFNDGNGADSGHVRIYENQSSVWTQIGNDIDGENTGDRSGTSVSLSSDGNIVAIGAPNNDGNGFNSGHVRIYENQSSVWTQIGNDIDGENGGNESGTSVSLTLNGNIVAIGSPTNSEIGSISGQVRFYKNILGVWTQLGTDINGQGNGDQLGFSLSLSSVGNVLAIGAPFSGNNNDSGHVEVYDLSAVLSIESFNEDYFSFYPNPVKDVLNVNINTGLELKQVNIYNTLSQYLYSVKTSKIDIRSLTSGLYFIEVETNQGKSAKRIIVE